MARGKRGVSGPEDWQTRPDCVLDETVVARNTSRTGSEPLHVPVLCDPLPGQLPSRGNDHSLRRERSRPQ